MHLTYVALHEMTYGCMVARCTQNAPRWQQFYVTSAMPVLQWIFKNAALKKKAIHSCTSTCECIESAQEQRLALYKSNQKQQQKLKCFDTRFRNTMCLVHLQLWGNLSFVVFCSAIYFGRRQRTVNRHFV